MNALFQVVTPMAAAIHQFELSGKPHHFIAFSALTEPNPDRAKGYIDQVKRIDGLAECIKNTWEHLQNGALVCELSGDYVEQIKEKVNRDVPGIFCWANMGNPQANNAALQPSPERTLCNIIGSKVFWRFFSKDNHRLEIKNVSDDVLFSKVRMEARAFNSNNAGAVDWLPEDKDSSGSEGKKQKQ